MLSKRLIFMISGILLFSSLSSGCGLINNPEPSIPSPQAELEIKDAVMPTATLPVFERGGYAELVTVLRAYGVQIEEAGEINEAFLEQDYIDVTGYLLKLIGSDVRVFEFDNDIFRKLVSDQISPDGSEIAGRLINLADQPNFWAKSRVIVLYLGTDSVMIDLITSIMGEPITTHE